MDRAPQLRVIARTGIGVDGVDEAEATRRRIAVCNAPDGPTVSTAEHTVALLLAVCKRLPLAQARLRSGDADLYARHVGMELDGATLGLVGYGRIARRVAVAARGLGMRVAIFDPYLREEPVDVDVCASLDELLSSADLVSLHIPLTAGSVAMFGAREFARMRDGAVFVNTARGRLVDHASLLAALESGKLFGAGLDVTDPEPLPSDHPLLGRDDVVVTGHVASATWATKRRLLRTAYDQVIQVLDGERPPHLVDPAAWPG
jgi:phosphoglycerate dehydrogenase-like enzyme